ncbi:MAG: DUF1049 domain-containing protein [Armatimonadetes bacterium]|nr:DUF1049 domain-containing protein [Armatimonadota bacterium]
MLILVLILFIIILQNTQVVELRLFFWKLSMSQIIYTLLIFLIGLIIGLISGKRGRRNFRQ